MTSDLTVHLDQPGKLDLHQRNCEPWSITMVDTGEMTNTAGRLMRVKDYIGDESFCFTYGDGLADLDITSLVSQHKQSSKIATVTAVKPPGRYGALCVDGTSVLNFQEKPDGDNAWISGGFFVLEPNVLDFIDSDNCCWETEVLPKLASIGELSAFYHRGFWRPMDTLRDRNHLQELWASKNAPWKKW